MVTAAVEHFLVKFLQPYVDGIDANDLHLSLWKGKLELTDVKVKPDVLGLLGIEGVRVPKGLVKRICITLPSTRRILSGKISVNVEGVELHGLHLSEDSDQEALRNVRSTKLQAVELRMTQLRDLQKRQQQAKEAYDQAEPGFGVRFAKRLITNLSLQLMDVKLAFNSQDPRAAFAAEMSSLEVISTDSSFKKVRQDEVLEEQGSSLYKVLSFDGLSLSYGQTSQELSKVVSPLRAELKVAHVPDDGLLRLEVDLATDKPSRIDLKRSQVVGVLALKSALKNKWDRLRGMLVDPQEEARLMATLDESKERYFSLFRQQCLSSVDKGEAKIVAALEQRGLNFAPLEPKEMKELETLENVLPFQLLAAARHRAEDYLAELVKMATPQQAKQASGGWFSRTFWRREPEESPLDKLSTEEILKELNDGKAEVEVVETPQKVKVVLCGGQVLLDLEEDTRTGPALKLLNLDLKTTSLAVKVESATDHRGQSSADFRLDLGLGSANVSHQGKPFLRPKEVDMEIQQALVLRLENKVEPSQNLMELSLIFAPLEIYMIPGLVASLLGFWPGPPEVEKAAGVSLTQPTIVREEISAFAPGPSRAERLRDVLEENASRAKELAEEVYKRIPDKIGLEIRLSSPTVYVPVAVGQAIITLGQLSLKSPEPCLFDNLHFNIDLNHTFISTVNQNNESFDVVEPLPIHISLKYMEQKDFLSVNVEVKVGQLSLSESPEAVQLLMGLPEAMVSTLTVPVEVKQIQDPAPSPPLEKPGEEAERASLKTLDVTHVLGEDFAALQRAEELQKKRMRTTVSVSFDDATFALSDSIMPLLRLRLEAMPPGLHVEVESGCMDLKLDEASLGVEILNPRHGVWEPFLERFDFALSMKLAETTSLNLNALGPLLINVVPTPTHQMLELLPLLLASLRPPKRCDQSESLSSAVAKTKLRLVSLWGGQLDLLCSNGSGAKATSTTVGVYPTGSNYLTLDGQVSLLALRQFRVRAPGSSYTSDPLWFEQNAAVMVPGCQGDVVAQLLTPQPDHRLLFVAPPLRLHNCTDVALAIRFHDSTTKAVVQQMDSAVCDASLLGLRELRLPEGEPISERSTENELILPPNSLCAVPTGAMGPKTGSAASTIISVRPLSSTSFSVPTLVGAQAIEGISCAQMHFLVVQAIENIGQQAGLEKVKTLSIRPPLLLTNALPIGRLGLQFASATVTVPALQRLCFYGTSLAELRRGLNLCAQLAEGPWSGKEFLAGDDVVDTTGNVQGDEAKVLELRISSKGAAAALNLECLGHGELRLSCPHWLLDRSGLKETSYGRLEVHTRGAPLPSLEGVTLLPSDCFETPCDFVIRGPNGSVAAKYSMKMPPNFEAFVWRVPNGCLALNLQTGTVLNSSVFGATCMEFTLMPRLLLTNASDEDLQIETSQRSQLRLAPGESRVMHWEVPENTDGIDVLATTFRFRPSYANAFSGAVLCSDASAGSTPFSLTTAPGVVEVWSVDVSPLHGNLGVSIRKGSDFAAVNRTEDVRMQVQPISRFIHGCVIAISSGTGEKVIEVAPGERLPIGWATPFAGNRCREAKVTVGSEELSIDLQRTGTWPLKALGHRHGWIREETTGLALRVSRHGTTTELSLEDSAEKGAGSPRSGAQVSDEISASLALRVKLGRAGISLIDENPPRELFFFSLDMLRLEYLQDAVRDSEKVTLSVSEVQAICQLPDRTDGQDKVNMLDPSRLQHLPDALFKNQEFPAVVLANHSAGGKSFLQFQMMREATSSRDLLISSARLDVDKLDFTLDERWLTPLQTWLMHISGQGGFDLFGAPASELLAKAGKPITDGYVAPPVPAVVQAQGVKISALDTTVWCSLRLKYLEFLPAYIRAAVKVFSASNYFTLDGVSLALPARELEPHRGSLQDYTTAIRADYSRSVLSHLASLLGKSSLLNLPKAPLKLGGAAVALMSDGLTDVTEGAVSMLRNLTMDEEFIERKNRSKGQIQGAGQGFAAAGKSLMEGVEGIFDVVRKPVEGAQTGGIWGFGTGLAKGAMGTLVKPVAALGTAVGEVADGLASTSNQLNVNEGSERRRNRRRLRLPRLLYGELGEVRPFVDIDAQLFQRYGQFLQGVCEVIPLERQGSDASRVTTVLLLFSQNLAVAAAREAPRNELTTLERSFPALAATPQESLLKEFTMSKVGGGLRGLSYADLQVFWIEGQVMHLKALNRDFKLDFTKAGLQEGAREALREGLQMAIDGRLQANRSWAELRAALRNDEHLARVRDMKMAAETGLKMIETDAARMSDRGAARIRRLEVFEVERFTLGFGWGTCNWPTDGELQWRWVQENGRKHPQVDERLTQKQATKAEEPPCQLGGLYKAAGPWSFEVIDKVTDKQGWVYGMAWSQPDWSQHQGLNLLRRRRWTRPFH